MHGENKSMVTINPTLNQQPTPASALTRFDSDSLRLANGAENFGTLNNTKTLIGIKASHQRPSTAGQLLDNLVESNENTHTEELEGSNSESSKSKEGGQGYVCPQRGCHKTFSRKLRLNAHLHLHYGTQPYKCTFPACGKAFSEKQNLRIHMRIHIDERPFQCPQGCGKSFRTKGTMRDHERRHFEDK